jgi:hypothetical protein
MENTKVEISEYILLTCKSLAAQELEELDLGQSGTNNRPCPIDSITKPENTSCAHKDEPPNGSAMSRGGRMSVLAPAKPGD